MLGATLGSYETKRHKTPAVRALAYNELSITSDCDLHHCRYSPNLAS
jgi:hypothetical protein